MMGHRPLGGVAVAMAAVAVLVTGTAASVACPVIAKLVVIRGPVV
jgi:hypothetical protein